MSRYLLILKWHKIFVVIIMIIKWCTERAKKKSTYNLCYVILSDSCHHIIIIIIILSSHAIYDISECHNVFFSSYFACLKLSYIKSIL